MRVAGLFFRVFGSAGPATVATLDGRGGSSRPTLCLRGVAARGPFQGVKSPTRAIGAGPRRGDTYGGPRKGGPCASGAQGSTITTSGQAAQAEGLIAAPFAATTVKGLAIAGRVGTPFRWAPEAVVLHHKCEPPRHPLQYNSFFTPLMSPSFRVGALFWERAPPL